MKEVVCQLKNFWSQNIDCLTEKHANICKHFQSYVPNTQQSNKAAGLSPTNVFNSML